MYSKNCAPIKVKMTNNLRRREYLVIFSKGFYYQNMNRQASFGLWCLVLQSHEFIRFREKNVKLLPPLHQNTHEEISLFLKSHEQSNPSGDMQPEQYNRQKKNKQFGACSCNVDCLMLTSILKQKRNGTYMTRENYM